MAIRQRQYDTPTRVITSVSILEEGDDNDLLTVREVARILRVDDTTVRRWIKGGALEAVTLPHSNRRQAYRIKLGTLRRVLGSVQVEQPQGTSTR